MSNQRKQPQQQQRQQQRIPEFFRRYRDRISSLQTLIDGIQRQIEENERRLNELREQINRLQTNRLQRNRLQNRNNPSLSGNIQQGKDGNQGNTNQAQKASSNKQQRKDGGN